MAWFQAYLLLLMFISLIFLLCLQQQAAAVLTTNNKPAAHCKNKCGDVDIPYPFGIGIDEGCSLDKEQFSVTCNDTYDPPRPFLIGSSLPLSNISVLDGQITLKYRIVYNCISDTLTWIAWSGKFTFSDTRNKFIAIGCDTLAYLEGKKSGSYGTGCISSCDSIDDVINGSCTGIGCCETSIPKGLKRYNVTVKSLYEERRNLSFNPCSYAFLAEENWFNFSSTYLKDFNPYGDGNVPVVLEWTIGNQTCHVAKFDLTTYGCGTNTDCYDQLSSPGYRCKCKKGYEGNPYLSGTGGCQAIEDAGTTEIITEVGPLDVKASQRLN